MIAGPDRRNREARRETKAWLADQPVHRFEIHFHLQSRLLAQSRRGLLLETRPFLLRHIRVSSKQELKDRLMAAVDFFNRDPVVRTWTYKLDKAA